MEKYGVSNEELKEELRAKYAELLERQQRLVKTGSADGGSFDTELQAVKAKLDALE